MGNKCRPTYSPVWRSISSSNLNEEEQREKLVKLVSNYSMQNITTCNILIVGLSGVGKSSLINSFYKSLDMDNSFSESPAKISHNNAHGTLHFQGFILQNINNFQVKVFDTKGINHDTSHEEVISFLAMLEGNVKEGQEIKVTEKYKKTGSVSKIPLFRPSGKTLLEKGSIDVSKLDPMHCVMIVVSPQVEFPKSSSSRQIKWCLEKGVPFFL